MIGESIKDFKITALLGKGGMGEIYLAVQQIVQTKVAIKLLREDISKDEQHVQRFFNEAIAASKIKHAGIVKIFDVGFHAQRAYLIMEYLEGEPLSARIRRAPKGMALEQVAEVASQAASILEATHAAGITHRDLKPDNIFVVADAELASKERVKILDFGIAKLAGPMTTVDAGGSTPVTATNTSMGTPAYMAPEQWRDAAKADARADVYSLGCVLFEMCVGRPPFVVTTMAEACTAHLTATPPRVASLAPDVPADVDALIAEMLAKEPAVRPTMHAIAAAFGPLRTTKREGAAATAETIAASAASSTSRTAKPTTPDALAATTAPTARRRWWPFVAIALVAAAAMAAIVVVAGIGRTSSRAAADAGAGAKPKPRACPVDMVEIPAGTFQMGSQAFPEEEPPHPVTLRAFCIDVTEVTVGNYNSCVAARSCAPAPVIQNVEGWDQERVAIYSRFCNGDREVIRDHPVNCVGWDQAREYCAWAGKRLPTEAEWEYAARGTHGLAYPWGNDPPAPHLLNACGDECRAYARRLSMTWRVMYEASDGFEGTAPVGSFPDGASPFGALDMAGNVAEWVEDEYALYEGAPDIVLGAPPGMRVVRDGSWRAYETQGVRTTNRTWGPPDLHTDAVGFRCARAVETP